MNTFVIAALVAVAAAGRLEHLERSYLPPGSNANDVGSPSFGSNGNFDSANGGFGSPSSGPFGTVGAGPASPNGGGSFNGATSNQYLPPNYGSSGSNGAPQFAGSMQGFAAQNNGQWQQDNGHQASQGQLNGSPQGRLSGAPSYQARFPQQSAAASRQYLAPHTGPSQNHPQQPFDEQTGYRY